MVLPMTLWLALEEDVARHKAEIAEQFAMARERLLPPETEQSSHGTLQLMYPGMMKDLSAQSAGNNVTFTGCYVCCGCSFCSGSHNAPSQWGTLANGLWP